MYYLLRALFIFSILIVSACNGVPNNIPQSSTPFPTYTPYSTYTPNPTYTPYPTYTSYPTTTAIVVSETATPSMANSADAVIEAFKSAGIPITNEVIYTAETDPNELLGRPHQYIAKLSWIDNRIASSGDSGVDTGGTIETFSNEEDLLARKEYIDELSKTPLFAQYIYSNGLLLLRISANLTPDEAKGYEDIFMSVP